MPPQHEVFFSFISWSCIPAVFTSMSSFVRSNLKHKEPFSFLFTTNKFRTANLLKQFHVKAGGRIQDGQFVKEFSPTPMLLHERDHPLIHSVMMIMMIMIIIIVIIIVPHLVSSITASVMLDPSLALVSMNNASISWKRC